MRLGPLALGGSLGECVYICSHFKCIIFDAWEYIVAKRIADVLPAQPHNGKSPEQKGSSKNGRKKKKNLPKMRKISTF